MEVARKVVVERRVVESAKVMYRINGARFTFRGTPSEVAAREGVLRDNGVEIIPETRGRPKAV